jgi:hypothetical protein
VHPCTIRTMASTDDRDAHLGASLPDGRDAEAITR